ncbi:MAG: hypothetical protein ACREDR_46845, partial [Blastocatellia bacterium]
MKDVFVIKTQNFRFGFVVGVLTFTLTLTTPTMRAGPERNAERIAGHEILKTINPIDGFNDPDEAVQPIREESLIYPNTVYEDSRGRFWVGCVSRLYT